MGQSFSLGRISGIRIGVNWSVLPRLTACAERRALVFSGDHLAGIISPTDISRAVERLSRNPGPFESSPH